jgi:hypothetical protein
MVMRGLDPRIHKGLIAPTSPAMTNESTECVAALGHYNLTWAMERNGHRTQAQARADQLATPTTAAQPFRRRLKP